MNNPEEALPDRAALEQWWSQIESWRDKHGLWTGVATRKAT
jgi:acetolactate synthase-1/2/3 large subunit